MKVFGTGALLIAAVMFLPGSYSEAWAQTKLARVGILAHNLELAGEPGKNWWEPFRRKLADRGWIEGKNVAFEFRKPSVESPQFTDAAAELVALNVDVISVVSG
jgi:hypothetical protein